MQSTHKALSLALLVMGQAGLAQDNADLKAKAAAAFESSCGTCHTGRPPLLVKAGKTDWDVVKANADRVIARVTSTTQPMPPNGVPPNAQLSSAQKNDLVAYVKTLQAPVQPEKYPLSKLKIEPGFKIEVFAEARGARSLAVDPSGVVFVGTGAFSDVDPEGRVYAIVPTSSGRKVVAMARGLNNPNGVAISGSDLFVGEATRVIRFPNAVETARNLAAGTATGTAAYSVVKDDLPQQGNHFWKYLAVGPDGKLYIPFGADCNVCEPTRDEAASLWRMDLDGSNFERVAKGIRNTVGFDWDPQTKQLWFTDNGRDELGDDIPPDELNTLSGDNLDFGFPHCFGSAIKDPDFGKNLTCDEPQFTKPTVDLGAHVAALGLTFYRGNMMPAPYNTGIFIAEHGSWNRSKKSGYRLSLVTRSTNAMGVVSYNYRPFISGWLDDATQTNWGRPVDVKNYVDGSLLLSDDHTGVVYRIIYQP